MNSVSAECQLPLPDDEVLAHQLVAPGSAHLRYPATGFLDLLCLPPSPPAGLVLGYRELDEPHLFSAFVFENNLDALGVGAQVGQFDEGEHLRTIRTQLGVRARFAPFDAVGHHEAFDLQCLRRLFGRRVRCVRLVRFSGRGRGCPRGVGGDGDFAFGGRSQGRRASAWAGSSVRERFLPNRLVPERPESPESDAQGAAGNACEYCFAQCRNHGGAPLKSAGDGTRWRSDAHAKGKARANQEIRNFRAERTPRWVRPPTPQSPPGHEANEPGGIAAQAPCASSDSAAIVINFVIRLVKLPGSSIGLPSAKSAWS